MRRLKWLAFSVAGLLLLLGIAAGWWFVSNSRPDAFGQHQPPAGLDPEVLNAHAGLYRTSDGDIVLLAPSAKGGLALYATGDYALQRRNILSRHIYRRGEAWWMDPEDDGAPRPVGFILDGVQAEGFTWQNGEGRQYVATRSLPPAYHVRAVEFSSDVSLSGTLLLPLSASPVPGAVLIHGSGSSDRDGLWYVLMARLLVEHGIAVLLPDKRGSGRSAGEWRTASFEDFAADALAGLHVLRAQPEVDASSTGIVGMSQGGWIAPLAASRSGEVAFVVNLVGASVTPREQTRHEILQQVRDAGVPAWLSPAVMPLTTRMPARRRPVWWKKNGDFDPLPLWRDIKQPALVVYGAEDEKDNVPVRRSVERLRALGKPESQLEVVVIPGVGHALTDRGNDELHPQLRDKLVEWIKTRRQESRDAE